MPRKTPRLSVEWRERIKAGEILNRLERHALGEVEMTQTQIRAAEVLLRKALPDLSAVEHSGEIAHKSLADMSNDELLNIARRGSAGTSNTAGSETKPKGVH